MVWDFINVFSKNNLYKVNVILLLINPYQVLTSRSSCDTVFLLLTKSKSAEWMKITKNFLTTVTVTGISILDISFLLSIYWYGYDLLKRKEIRLLKLKAISMCLRYFLLSLEPVFSFFVPSSKSIRIVHQIKRLKIYPNSQEKAAVITAAAGPKIGAKAGAAILAATPAATGASPLTKSKNPGSFAFNWASFVSSI